MKVYDPSRKRNRRPPDHRTLLERLIDRVGQQVGIEIRQNADGSWSWRLTLLALAVLLTFFSARGCFGA